MRSGEYPTKKSVFHFLPECLLENGDTGLFRGTRINRRFVHDDGALLEVLANGTGGTDQWAEIGLVRIVDRSWHGNDHEIGLSQRCGIGADFEQGGCLQVFRAHFAGRIEMLPVAGDFFSR